MNQTDHQGATPFCVACQKGYTPIVKCLLQSRHDINIEWVAHPSAGCAGHTQAGRTALMSACEHGHASVVELLLQVLGGINVNFVEKTVGASALLLASQEGQSACVELLLGVSSIDINQLTNSNQTALMMASYFGREDIVRMLLQRPDINLDVKSSERGMSALDCAQKNNYGQIVQLLKDAVVERSVRLLRTIHKEVVVEEERVERERKIAGEIELVEADGDDDDDDDDDEEEEEMKMALALSMSLEKKT